MVVYKAYMTIRLEKKLQKDLRDFVKKHTQYKLSGIAGEGIKRYLEILIKKENNNNGTSEG